MNSQTRKGRGAAPDPEAAKRNLEYTLARARPRELAHDYLDLCSGAKEPAAADENLDNSPEAIQARARERRREAEVRLRRAEAS